MLIHIKNLLPFKYKRALKISNSEGLVGLTITFEVHEKTFGYFNGHRPHSIEYEKLEIDKDKERLVFTDMRGVEWYVEELTWEFWNKIKKGLGDVPEFEDIFEVQEWYKTEFWEQEGMNY